MHATLLGKSESEDFCKAPINIKTPKNNKKHQNKINKKGKLKEKCGQKSPNLKIPQTAYSKKAVCGIIP